MNFKQWLEATVPINDVGEAIAKTLKFKIPGDWEFQIGEKKIDRHGQPPSVMVRAFLRNEKTPKPAKFWLSIWAILYKDIDSYDSINGSTGMRIIVSISYNHSHSFIKLGERSEDKPRHVDRHDGASLRTPYELAEWITTVINDFGNDDDNGREPETPTPRVSNPQLVGA